MTRSRLLWFIYVIAIAALGIGHAIEKIASDAGGPSSRYGPLIGALLIAIGIVGLARGVRIGRRWMWVLVTVLAGLATCGLVLLEVMTLKNGAPILVHLQIVLAIVLTAIGAIGMHRYALGPPSPWHHGADNSDAA